MKTFANFLSGLLLIAATSNADLLPNGNCQVAGNVDHMALNRAGGFSFTLRNAAASCNGVAVANPQVRGCTNFNGSTCLSADNVGVGNWYVAYSTSDVNTLARMQSLIQNAAATGQSVTYTLTIANGVPTTYDYNWLSLSPGFIFTTLP